MTSASSNRLWVIGSMLLIIVIGALGWILGISPQLEAARAADAQVGEVEAQNSVLEIDLIALKEQFGRIDEYRGELNALRREIPLTASMQDFLPQLQNSAVATGVTIVDMTTEAASIFLPVEGSLAAATGIDPSTVGYIPMTITVAGARENVLAFVQSLQSGNQRLTLISDLNAVAQEGGDLTQLSGAIFVKFDPQALPGDAILPEVPVVEETTEGETTEEETTEP